MFFPFFVIFYILDFVNLGVSVCVCKNKNQKHNYNHYCCSIWSFVAPDATLKLYK